MSSFRLSLNCMYQSCPQLVGSRDHWGVMAWDGVFRGSRGRWVGGSRGWGWVGGSRVR